MKIKQLLKCFSPFHFRKCMDNISYKEHSKTSNEVDDTLRLTDEALSELQKKITELELTVNGDKYLFIKAEKKNG